MSLLLDQYFLRAELAHEINRTPRTLARWEALGVGPPITWIGRTPHYRIPSAKAWLEAQEQRCAPHAGRATGRKRSLRCGQ